MSDPETRGGGGHRVRGGRGIAATNPSPHAKECGKLAVIKDRGYDKQAIDILEELLNRARAGDITDLVCSFATSSNSYELCYTGTDDLISLVGHLEKMKWRMLERMNTYK
jgi:hypothetical protein